MYKEAAMEKEMKKKIDIEGNGNGGRRTPSLRGNSRGGSVSGGREGGLGTGDLDGGNGGGGDLDGGDDGGGGDNKDGEEETISNAMNYVSDNGEVVGQTILR